ncbi:MULTISPECIES: sensor histidine kinase [Streptomyces]|uniref:histidine kinase n=1 Tax=Streptomyces filamentosus TaxID=67294 RepID=A0A919BZM6_STRFL|nr:histidine kinase [Streptomyces filamentosus]GHG29219.1 two-component sensor histidine kinase [Streptomyces filamentosus]
MKHRERPAWPAIGRFVTVVGLTVLALFNQSQVFDSGDGLLWVRSAVLVVCGSLLLLGRRLPWPIAPLVITAATAWWGWLLLPLFCVALYDLAVRRRAWVAVGCAAVATVVNLPARPSVSPEAPALANSVLFMALVICGGLLVSSHRRLVASLNAQVGHLRTEQELREQAARAAERSRIAAEMHDVLAHRLSLIALHTGVLAARREALPDTVVERLGLLRTASTEALADLRDVLGALRDPDATAPQTVPAPALRDVRELVEESRAAGQDITLDIEGLPENAPAAHRLAVYRLVQEALTNARKHAAGAPVRVRLDYGPPATLIEVTNPPGTPSATPVASGFGLIGLRERVTALGGELHAGAGGAGTWRLAARIPHPTHNEQNGPRS